ncbi:MAG: hypothetical protein P8188_18260 [Gemmatimonadota bacterium]|jgi:hypothetical protein
MGTVEQETMFEGSMDQENDTSVIGVVRTHSDAEEVVKELQKSGFDMKKLSVIGKGYHSEEHPLGFYSTGDRIKSWGGIGAFWGGLWGLLFGAAFFWIPGIGPLAVAGPFVHAIVTGLEGAFLVGGVGVVGAALMGLGVSKESIIRYETRLKADNYLVIAHGTSEEVDRARSILRHSSLEEPEVVVAGASASRHAGFQV